MTGKPYFLLVMVLLTLLPACRYRQACTDPAALNYTNADPEYESNPGLCKYGPAVKLAGNWMYTDTFTYYPPLGGTPQTSYTPHQANLQFTGGGGNMLFISGLPNGNGDGMVYTDSIVCYNFTLFVHNVNDTPAYITFTDGLTNSATGYMFKQY